MKRRNFFGWLGISWIASLLPMAIAACSRQTAESPAPSGAGTTASNTPPRTDGFVSVGTVAALDQGGLLKTTIAGKSVGVLRDTSNRDTLRAVDLICPHAGCVVDWQSANKTFKCPCHGAEFSPDGKVLEGPAKSSLPIYAAKLEGNNVFVKVS